VSGNAVRGLTHMAQVTCAQRPHVVGLSAPPTTRGLHSSTSQLNLSRF